MNPTEQKRQLKQKLCSMRITSVARAIDQHE
jgi:hypothetical protein